MAAPTENRRHKSRPHPSKEAAATMPPEKERRPHHDRSSSREGRPSRSVSKSHKSGGGSGGGGGGSSSRETNSSSPHRRWRSRSRSRSESEERKHHAKRRSESEERKHHAKRRSESEERKHHTRSTSRSRKEHTKEKARTSSSSRVKKSNGRCDSDMSKRRERSQSQGRDRDRSHSRDRSAPDGRRDGVDDDDDDASVRRLRKSTKEKRSTYVKSGTAQKKDKEHSDGRKSSVLGSLHSFLEEAKEASPQPGKDSGDRSAVSSASKIRRKKRNSMPSGSASVYGGHVTGRDDTRQRRRSKSSSVVESSDTGSIVERRRELRKDRERKSRSKSRSRTPSSRNRHAALSEELESQGDSMQPSQPSDYPPNTSESSTRHRRTLTASNGAEIPPGFPVAAVDKKAAPGTVVAEDLESSMPNTPPILESTVKIRERQQRRASMNNATSQSSVAPDGNNRKLRRLASLNSMGAAIAGAPSLTKMPQGEAKVSHSSLPALSNTKETPTTAEPDSAMSETTQKNASDLDASLTTRLGKVGGKVRRKKGSSQSVASAPALSDKHKKRSSNKKRSKESSSKNEAKSMPAKNGKKGVMGFIKGIGSKKKEKDDKEEGPKAKDYSHSLNDLMNASVASLDPTVLIKKSSEPGKRINSVVELYHEGGDEGSEGSEELKEDSLHGDAAAIFKKAYGTPPNSNQSVIYFDSMQLQQAAALFGPLGPPGTPGSSVRRSLSPHSNYSGNSEQPRSPGLLRRQVGQASADSLALNKRVSWVELPWNNPENLVIKSSDTDGANERATAATADTVSAVDDLGDDKKIADAVISAQQKGAAEKKLEKEKNLSLDVAFEQNEKERIKQSSDERTVGTTSTSNTHTSESTMKTTNRSGIPQKSSEPSSATAITDSKYQDSMTTEDLAKVVKSGSSSSLSRSSLRRSKDLSSDGSSSSSSRKSKKDEDQSEKNMRRKTSKRLSRSKDKGGRNKDEATGDMEPTSKETRRRGDSRDRSSRDSSTSVEPKRRQPRRPDIDSSKKAAGGRAGSKIRYLPKGGSSDSQSIGEPTNEKNQEKSVRVNTVEPDDGSQSQLRKRKSYLNRRTLMKQEKAKSEAAKQSVQSSLDSFLAKMGDDDTESIVKDDHRSVHSDGRQKDRKQRLRTKRRSADDRSVISAPALVSRRSKRALDSPKRPAQEGITSRLKKMDVAF